MREDSDMELTELGWHQGADPCSLIQHCAQGEGWKNPNLRMTMAKVYKAKGEWI